MPYRNLDGSGPQPPGVVFRWAVLDKLRGRRRKSPATAPVPFVKTSPASVATPPAAGEPARLTWLGHASWLVQLEGVSLLIDPALCPVIGFVVKRNVEPGL